MFRSKHTIVALLLVGLVSFIHLPGATLHSDPQQEHQAIAFVEVNVVPMDSERVLEQQTVIVRDDKIVEIGPASAVPVPSDAVPIDGRGKYLMPGLADMHVHSALFQRKSDLLTYVANGVTTIRDMWGNTNGLEWREQIARGELLGPTMYVSARPFFNETPKEAVQLVDERVAAGYDFIKVYNPVSKATYDSVIAAANRRGMRVVGHVPLSVGLQEAFAAGQASIEHLYTGYIFELVPPDAPIQPQNDIRSRVLAWNYADVSEFSRLAAGTHDAGVWVCPTLVRVQHSALPTERYLRLFTRPEWRYMPPQHYNKQLMAREAPWSHLRTFSEDDFRSAQEGAEVQKIFIKALHEAGVGLLLGTDVWTGGFAVHEELRNFVDAGLSPYEAIRTGTRNAAEFLNATDTFGTVAVGLRADLILVEANPLDDVANVARRVGVMVRGRWLPEEELQQRLDSLAVFMDLWKLGAFFEREDNPKYAMAAYSSALAFDSTLTIDNWFWNALCWTGSRTGHAAEVLSACERAVALRALGLTEDFQWWVRDSRGLARALTGDLPGAIEDFEAYVAGTSNDESRSQRQGWIDALRRGENPFTPEVLRALSRK
jgi:imidazolonepropionase-like amidohydrolase